MADELQSTRPTNVTKIDLLPEPLKNVRVLASKLLASMLANMFDNTDDVFFDLADKADDTDDKNMHLDSMREIRIKRQSMEKLFAQSLLDGFKIFQRAASKSTEVSDSFSGLEGSLSLVQDDELEENLAVRGMVSKVMNQLGEPLQQLTQRMNHLAKQASIDEENNPLGPAKIGEAFQSASKELGLNIRSKLVIYKLFEKFVLAELEELYATANESLVEAGVMPQLVLPKRIQTRGAKARPSSSDDAREQEKTAAAASAQKDEVFSLLRELLANRAPHLQPSSAYLPVADKGPVLSQTELVDMLSTVQHDKLPDSGALEPSAIDVRRVLHNMVDSRGGHLPQAVGRVDDDSINLVSMLFEYILDDHTLSIQMKALLGRLQIPMLKVALLDKSFFSKGAHPARKLLNELASAALRWNEPADVTRDPLFNKINDVINEILNEFEDNVSIFEKLLDDFAVFAEKEKRRSELIEQRTRDAEEGLGKAQRARAEVANLINQKAEGKSLPAAVIELLREGWSNYLFLMHVKEGVESAKWQEAVKVVDDLIWSVGERDSFESRRELLNIIPSLLQRLREGLNVTSFNKSRMRDLFSALEQIHLTCLKTEQSTSAFDDESEPAISDEAVANAENDEAEALQVHQKVTAVITDAPKLETLDKETESLEADDQSVQMVDLMVVGAWVEFLNENEQKSRCKLAAIIRASGKYIFVNRVGIKIAEHTRSSLIEVAQAGRIAMLDNALLFDRALESVIGCLREMKD